MHNTEWKCKLQNTVFIDTIYTKLNIHMHTHSLCIYFYTKCKNKTEKNAFAWMFLCVETQLGAIS